MDYSEILLGLRQAIACNKISQQDLNLIIQYPEARETLREAFGTLNAEQINRRLNDAEMSMTENETGQHQLVMRSPGGFPLVMTLPPAQLPSNPEPNEHRAERRVADDETVPCACHGLYVCEITETEVYPHEQPLPSFDPPFDLSVERIAPDRYPEVPAGAMASGDFSKVEITRESVSVEEVIAKIEALEKEVIDEHGTSR